MRNQRELFYWKSTIGTKIAAIEVSNDMHCLQKQIEKFPLQVISYMRRNTKGNNHIIKLYFLVSFFC